MKQYNIISISMDELRADSLGYSGNPDVQSPNIDQLANDSLRFNKHFTVFPKCAPARTAMLTGRYCHSDGHRTINHSDLIQKHEPSLVKALNENGYETCLLGLNHMYEDVYSGSNDKGHSTPTYHSFTTGIFDEINEKTYTIDTKGEAKAGAVNFETQCPVGERAKFNDNQRSDQALHYLENVRDKNKPFYLHLNLSLPHPPYKVEEPWYSMYDPDKISAFTHDYPEPASIPFQAMRKYRRGEASEKDFRQVQAVYYGMISKTDELVGRVLNKLKALGLYENSVIVFWSDHGDYAGQYGLVEKWDTAMNDCLLHVPFLLKLPDDHPQKQSGDIQGMTEHIDYAPTLLSLSNTTAEESWEIHGESLVNDTNIHNGKTAVFANGGHEASMRKRHNVPLLDKQGRPNTLGKQSAYKEMPESMARTRMIRTEDYKLVVRENADNELYDLKNDPLELKNIFSDKAFDRIKLELFQQLMQMTCRTDNSGRFQERVGA